MGAFLPASESAFGGTVDEPFIEYDAAMKEARAILAQTP